MRVDHVEFEEALDSSSMQTIVRSDIGNLNTIRLVVIDDIMSYVNAHLQAWNVKIEFGIIQNHGRAILESGRIASRKEIHAA